MGARNSKQTEASFLNQYDVLQTNPTENITYLQHKKSEEEYLLREFTFNDKKQCDRTMQKLVDLQMKLKGSKHVVPLKDHLMTTEDQYCSTFYKIYSLFEYPQRTLEDEINDRRLKMKRFSETQLWSILASCIVGLSHLQRNNIKHSALKSNRVLISRDGIIKIADPFAIGDNTNYENALTKRISLHAYLSPEQTQFLQQETNSPDYNTYKSDVFTLGMIILEAGLFQYQDEQCYRDQKTRIHWDSVKYHIDRLGQAYSSEIMNMVEIMLFKDQKARPDWIQLQSHVMKGDDLGGSLIQDDHKDRSFTNSDFTPSSAKPNNQYSQINFTPHTVRNSHVHPLPIVASQGGFNNYQMSPRILTNQVINQVPQVHNHIPFVQTLGQTLGNYSSPASPFVPQSNTTFHPLNSLHQNFQGSQFPPNQTNHFVHPNGKPIQNQILQSNQQIPKYQNSQINGIPGLGIPPLKMSIIENTRPARNIFPADNYIIKTKFDENLVVMAQDQYETQSNGNLDIQNSRNLNNQHFNNNHVRYTSYSSANDQMQRPLLTSPGPKFNSNNQFNSQPNISKAQVSHPKELIYTTQSFKLGSRYEGYKLDGLRHGYGKFYYQDGGMYDGNWKQNTMEGHGKLFYQSGKLAYDGEWKQNKFMGKGTLYNETPEPLDRPYDYRDFDELDQFWTKYEGQFQDDAKNGYGVLFLSNGERFEGNFASDSVSGPGIFYLRNGSRISGNWANNRKI